MTKHLAQNQFCNHIKSTIFGSLLWIAVAAYTSLAHANVVGTDAQNFNPTTSGLDFVTVHSSETLKPGIINLGLYLNYAVNSLPYFERGSGQSRLNFNDTLISSDVNMGLGLTKNWDVGISFPAVLQQSVSDQTGVRGEYQSTGATEFRANTKYRLWGTDSGGIAVIGSMNVNQIANNPFIGSGAGPTFNTELAADTTIDRVALGVNIGYRFRQPGTRIPNSQVAPLKDQMIASTAASYHVPAWDTKFIGELFGSLPAQTSDSNSDRSLSSLEALLGAKHDVNINLALHAGMGAGLIRGFASPDWRVYTGLNYTFGPTWGFDVPSSPPPPGEPYLEPVVSHAEPLQKLPVPAQAERFRTQKILFAFDSDQMVGNFAPALVELASHLRKGFRELVVEGHTDSTGSVSYNEKLSLRRAAAIKRYMVSKFGIDEKKIVVNGFGPSRPIADNGNYQGRQLNRRVEFVIRR